MCLGRYKESHRNRRSAQGRRTIAPTYAGQLETPIESIAAFGEISGQVVTALTALQIPVRAFKVADHDFSPDEFLVFEVIRRDTVLLLGEELYRQETGGQRQFGMRADDVADQRRLMMALVALAAVARDEGNAWILVVTTFLLVRKIAIMLRKSSASQGSLQHASLHMTRRIHTRA